MGTSLYAGAPFMKKCKENGFKYLLRFKEGSIPYPQGYKLHRQILTCIDETNTNDTYVKKLGCSIHPSLRNNEIVF